MNLPARLSLMSSLEANKDGVSFVKGFQRSVHFRPLAQFGEMYRELRYKLGTRGIVRNFCSKDGFRIRQAVRSPIERIEDVVNRDVCLIPLNKLFRDPLPFA